VRRANFLRACNKTPNRYPSGGCLHADSQHSATRVGLRSILHTSVQDHLECGLHLSRLRIDEEALAVCRGRIREDVVRRESGKRSKLEQRLGRPRGIRSSADRHRHDLHARQARFHVEQLLAVGSPARLAAVRARQRDLPFRFGKARTAVERAEVQQL